MPENEKTYMYGIQWVDDGGPFDHATCFDDFEEPFQKMGIALDQIISEQAVLLKNGETHYMIKMKQPIPYWSISGLVSSSPHRYSSTCGLWLYTFTIEEQDIQKHLTIEEWDEINGF